METGAAGAILVAQVEAAKLIAGGGAAEGVGEAARGVGATGGKFLGAASAWGAGVGEADAQVGIEGQAMIAAGAVGLGLFEGSAALAAGAADA